MSRSLPVSLRPWLITVMLALFMTINFMDKAVLGIVAIPLMKELKLGPAEFGFVASSFFFLFSISAIFFGFFATKWRAKTLLLVAALIWAVAQFPLAFTASVPLLLFSRILLGCGEGPAYPLSLHACYKWFTNDKRNLPSTVIFQGSVVGILISGPLLTYFLVRHGWHSAFLALGVASLIWMVVWALFGAEGTVTTQETTRTATHAGSQKVSYLLLLTDRTFLGNMALYWTTYWVFSLIFTWVPSYLRTVMHYDATTAGWMFMLFTSVNIPIVLGGSWLSQRMLKSHVASARARGWLICGFGLAGGLLIWLAVYGIHAPLLKTAVLALGCNFPQISFVLGSAIVAEVTPDGQRSAMMSINSALATTGGLVSPALMGILIGGAATPTLGYDTGFAIAGALSVAASLFGFWAINPEASKRRLAGLTGQIAVQPALRRAVVVD